MTTPFPQTTISTAQVNGKPVRIDVDFIRRLPTLEIVGVRSGAGRDLAARVREDILRRGFGDLPRLRIVVALSPQQPASAVPALVAPIVEAIVRRWNAQREVPASGKGLFGGLGGLGLPPAEHEERAQSLAKDLERSAHTAEEHLRDFPRFASTDDLLFDLRSIWHLMGAIEAETQAARGPRGVKLQAAFDARKVAERVSAKLAACNCGSR